MRHNVEYNFYAILFASSNIFFFFLVIINYGNYFFMNGDELFSLILVLKMSLSCLVTAKIVTIQIWYSLHAF